MIFANNNLMKLFKYARPNKKTIVLASLWSALNRVCDIIPEILLAVSIDVVVNGSKSSVAALGISDPVTQLYVVGFFTAFVWMLESLFEYLYFMSWHSLAQGIQTKLRIATYDKIQTLDVAYFENTTTGGLLTVLQDDVLQLEFFFSRAPNEVIQLIVNIVVIGTIFFCVSPTLFLLAVVPIPFVIIIAYFFQKKLSMLYGIMRQLSSGLASHIVYRLGGLTTIQSYNSQRYELARLVAATNKYASSSDNVSAITALYVQAVRMAVMFGFIMTLIVGGLKVIHGVIAMHWYAELVFLIQRFLWPFTGLTTISDMYEKSSASARRVDEILSAQPAIVDKPDAISVKACPGLIEFKDVSFVYGAGYEVFNHLNFSIAPKSMVAFVGSTGSGKSTIAKLLLRFYDVGEGAILIDGHDIRDIKLANLRASMGLVSQDVYMVDGSIADNIAYGSFHATRQDIIAAATMAQLHDFIMDLPDGYDTKVSENGKNFSGGQKQRIAIARAILKRSCIVIFDEATSALDNETEAEISKSMMLLKQNHSVIIIAHRLSTVRHADTIFVLDKGVIVESGSHDELVALQGAYAQLLQHASL